MSEHDMYRQKLQSQLEELNLRMNRLAERAGGVHGKEGVEARRQLDSCRAQRGETLARLQLWDEVRRPA